MVIQNGAGYPEEELAQVLGIINALAGKAVSGDYIFRGETRNYDVVSSSLYRDHRGVPDIEALQQADLDEAKRYTSETDEFAILTELQHYGGHTNLIDFTTDCLIALFFACNGDFAQDGRVILLEVSFGTIEYMHEPRNPMSRVLAQKSVFVRPPEGYVEPDDTIIIPHDIKLPMLNYLKKAHGISYETIYNDIHGFIRSRAMQRESLEHFGRAVTSHERGNYQAAIASFNEALDLNPFLLAAYFMRGVAHYHIDSFDQAITDYNQAIKLDPDYAAAYSNRGAAYLREGDISQAIENCINAIDLEQDYAHPHIILGLAHDRNGDFDLAIADFNRALELDFFNIAIYINRGITHVHKGDYDQAIVDYNSALDLDPNSATTHANLGEAWLHLSEWAKARTNLLAARGMGFDIVASFHNDYESVSDFEQRTGLSLPDDIAEMLGG